MSAFTLEQLEPGLWIIYGPGEERHIWIQGNDPDIEEFWEHVTCQRDRSWGDVITLLEHHSDWIKVIPKPEGVEFIP